MRLLYNRPATLDRRRELRKNLTDGERILWNALRRRMFGVRWRRQYSVDVFILDFYCPAARCAIELDGSQHLKQIEYDRQRTEYLQSLNIFVQRYWNSEVLQNLEGVLIEVEVMLKKRLQITKFENGTPPNLPFQGEGFETERNLFL